jgi:hypothetical protein
MSIRSRSYGKKEEEEADPEKRSLEFAVDAAIITAAALAPTYSSSSSSSSFPLVVSIATSVTPSSCWTRSGP